MATIPLLFDLGRSPTTRDLAKLVKDGGLEALPDARRRGDAATYQEIHISVPTVDEEAWVQLEPGVAHPMQRLRAVRELVGASRANQCLICD